jgi:hypothetical protein
MANLRGPIALCLATGLTITACTSQHGQRAHVAHQAAALLELLGSNPAPVIEIGEHDPPLRYPSENIAPATAAVGSASSSASYYSGSQDPSTGPWTFVWPARRST